ncbi:hypothetical protein SEPCBS57363_005638 [Sporothrix epigloea]|uniref:Uncharacterized protein n=1 Tax=Sporothrix epigloea TaxID=1892477 RepID=A0ABP0DYY2_9PEZI
MDRDNPSTSSSLRGGATFVEKTKLEYRPTQNDTSGHIVPLSNTHTSFPTRALPHLGSKQQLSSTSRPSLTDDETSGSDITPQRASSLLSSSSASTTRRNGNSRRVIRPADRSRPTVHFNNSRSAAPLMPIAPSTAAVDNKSANGLSFTPTNSKTSGLSWRTALSWRTSPSSMQQNSTAPSNGHKDSSACDGSIASSISTCPSSTSYSTKRVTFDSSETEDSASCLSASTQATSVDEHEGFDECDNHNKFEPCKSSTTFIPAPEQTSIYTVQSSSPLRTSARFLNLAATPVQQPARWRSRSVGGINREMLRSEAVELSQIPAQQLHNSYTYVPTGELSQDAAKMSGSSVVSITSTATSTDTNTTKNMQAQFEAHKVALEAQFELRQQAWDVEKSKLSEELRAAMDSLGKSQANAENLRREANEQRQRMLALSQENESLKEVQENAVRAQDGALQAWAASDRQEILQLQADLESAREACSNTQTALTEAHQTLATANVALDELRVALAEEQNTSALFREGKMAFESRCSDLEVKCSSLESQVVVARSANKELHLLLASQIDDLTATKEALQVRIGILEEEEATRVAATVAAVAATKTAEDKLVAVTVHFAEEKKALEDAVISAEAKAAALDIAKMAITEEHKACREKIEELNATFAAKAEELDMLTADLAVANAARASMHETAVGHDAAINKARLDGGEAATAAVIEVSDAPQTTIDNLQAEVANLKMGCGSLKSAAAAERTVGEAPALFNTDNNALLEKYTELEASYGELQEKYAALEAALDNGKEPAAVTLAAAKANSATSPEGALTTETANDAIELAAKSSQLSELTASFQHIQAAYTTSEAEVMALRDQLAKMRGKLANLAVTVANSSSSATKKNVKGKKDELVIVRTHGDRGRFQVMRKSELHRSRSNSQSSRKTDYDSA